MYVWYSLMPCLFPRISSIQLHSQDFYPKIGHNEEEHASSTNTEENTRPRHPRKLVMKTVDQSPYVQMAPSNLSCRTNNETIYHLISYQVKITNFNWKIEILGWFKPYHITWLLIDRNMTEFHALVNIQITKRIYTPPWPDAWLWGWHFPNKRAKPSGEEFVTAYFSIDGIL